MRGVASFNLHANQAKFARRDRESVLSKAKVAILSFAVLFFNFKWLGCYRGAFSPLNCSELVIFLPVGVVPRPISTP